MHVHYYIHFYFIHFIYIKTFLLKDFDIKIFLIKNVLQNMGLKPLLYHNIKLKSCDFFSIFFSEGKYPEATIEKFRQKFYF
jgi:hypothetical protein